MFADLNIRVAPAPTRFGLCCDMITGVFQLKRLDSFFMTCRPPRSPPFPYTPLFRSLSRGRSSPLWPRSLSKPTPPADTERSEEHTSELQSLRHLVCRLLLEKKKRCRRTAGCRRCSRMTYRSP